MFRVLLDQLDLNGSAVRRARSRQVSRYRRVPRTIDELLGALAGAGSGCPNFARDFHDDHSRGAER